MANINKKTKEQKILYDQLWLELEAQLPSPRKKKDRIFLWLTFLMIGTVALSFWWLTDKGRTSNIEANTLPISEFANETPRQVNKGVVIVHPKEKTKDLTNSAVISDRDDVSLNHDKKNIIRASKRYKATSTFTQKPATASLFSTDRNLTTKRFVDTTTPQAATSETELEAPASIPSERLSLLSYSRDIIDLRIKFLHLNQQENEQGALRLSLIHISEPTRPY